MIKAKLFNHIDGNKKNNSIDNLEVMDIQSHARLHGSVGVSMVEVKCPECGIRFIIERRSSHLSKKGNYTTCSRSCSGKFSHKFRNGTPEVEAAISGNIVRSFKIHDNPEVTEYNQEP